MAQDPYWDRPGGGTSVGALEEMLSVVRQELERTHGVATEARELGQRALEAAEAAQAAREEQRATPATDEADRATRATRSPERTGSEPVGGVPAGPGGADDAPTSAAAARAGARGGGKPRAGVGDAVPRHGGGGRAGAARAPAGADQPEHGDPLAAALAEFAGELQAAADARARGELDVWEALRLLRGGFHKTRRVLGSLQRRDVGRA